MVWKTSACSRRAAAARSAQDAAPTNGPGQEAPTPPANAPQNGDIIVTAQRVSQRLQDVPIAISAFTAQNLEKQQIVNPLALQQSLPNITFTKTNFTTSSFTIRGIGDLCTGATCDTATGIAVNDMPLVTTRLFESEFFDLERVEVLRGPQGTLFGRNATSGVVNFITAKPDLSGIHAAGEFEYGNYDSKQAKGMFNLPITDTLGIRVAGLYLKRGGYTHNLYDNTNIDGRDLYSIRGTLSYEPTSDTRIDLIGYYFHEKDDRSRIQKQLCHRDPTGILGCLPDTLAYQTANGNSTLAAVLSSQQLFAIQGGAAAGALVSRLGITNLYGPDTYTGVVNPADVRTVNIDYDPTYYAEEEQYTVKIFHDFGKISMNFTGGYTRNVVDSTTDYNLAVEGSLANNSGLNFLNAAGRTGTPFYGIFNGVRQTLIPNGTGSLCQSAADPNNLGVYGGASQGCFPESLDFDRSRQVNRQYSAELHVQSAFDGPFNFLLGGIYLDNKSTNTDYFVNAFGLDYASGILGSLSALGAGAPAGNGYFLATPFYRNADEVFRLKSYGIFGETYLKFNDKLKLTVGLRYNHDQKNDQARNTALNVLTPIGATSITQGLNYAQTDFDPNTPGVQEYSFAQVSFSRLTGRAVLDYKISENNLLYISYSRGYKSGGINPPLLPQFNVSSTFAPEQVNAFEIGSKNTFMNGQLRLNLTGFYYQYKQLQLSRIVARTSVNDNVDANIYGVEAEAVVSPIPAFVINMNASYLHSSVSSDKFLVNPRDVSAGRGDAVIIKDISNGSNCVVIPTGAGGAALTNGYVTAVNAAVGLQAPTAIPTVAATGAFGICSVLGGSGGTAAQKMQAAASGVQVLDGVSVDIKSNQLPQAPTYKFSVGAQYTIDFGNGMSLVPRADLNFTGNFYASIFNQNIDRVQGYSVINAQLQLNARDDRFYVRGFVQNLANNNAITGQYVTDQSSGLFTNIFTLEPRRYGVAVGFKF